MSDTKPNMDKIEDKPTNVGRIALERQARQFNSGPVA